MTLTAQSPEAQATVDVLAAREYELRFPALTLNDRCDRCQQAAVAQVSADPTVDNLLFCGHHFRANKVRFEAAGWPFDVAPDEAELHTFRSWEKPRSNAARDAGSV